MKIRFPVNKKKQTLLIIITPIIFWSLSEIIPVIISEFNQRIANNHPTTIPSEKAGTLTIFNKDSIIQKTVSQIKFPLSRKLDPRFDYEKFRLTITGLIEVKEPGIYWFGSESDDGSWIWIDGKKILDNGGLHSRLEVRNFVQLVKGIHNIKIQWENLLGDAYLEVFWVPPNSSPQAIPIYSHPFSRVIFDLYRISLICFKIAQYWVFFFSPFLLYNHFLKH